MKYAIEDRLKELMKRDNTHEKDNERKSLFYLIGGNLELYENADLVYNFKERTIKLEALQSNQLKISSSAIDLIKLGFSLYNGYNANILTTFQNLDDENFELAIKAIRIRFNKPSKKGWLE